MHSKPTPTTSSSTRPATNVGTTPAIHRNDTGSTPDQHPDDTVDTGAIVGGVVGSIVALILIAVVVFFVVRFNRNKRQAPQKSNPSGSSPKTNDYRLDSASAPATVPPVIHNGGTNLSPSDPVLYVDAPVSHTYHSSNPPNDVTTRGLHQITNPEDIDVVYVFEENAVKVAPPTERQNKSYDYCYVTGPQNSADFYSAPVTGPGSGNGGSVDDTVLVENPFYSH